MYFQISITFPTADGLPRQVKLSSIGQSKIISGIRLSKIIKGSVLTDLEGKGLLTCNSSATIYTYNVTVHPANFSSRYKYQYFK